MISRRVPTVLLAALPAALLALGSAPVAGQDDVRALGARYGTTPPAGYFETLAARPDAYRFRRAWQGRNLQAPEAVRSPAEASGGTLDGATPEGLTLGGSGMLQATLGPRPRGITGTLAFPVLLGYFADASAPPVFDRARVQAHFLEGPNPRGGSLREYFAELSGGRLDFTGVGMGWYRSAFAGGEVAGSSNGLSVSTSRTGPYIAGLLEQADDGSIDWGQFDNDGPDGIPNSGDDDGFVDVLAVLHPRGGAECNGAAGRIWSHRWTLSAWLGSPWETSSPAAGGGRIRVDDYTIQPLLNCDETDIGDIGVFAHELGHGLGLPDLYCTGFGCELSVVGNWGLMSSGGWGCDGSTAAVPCHMSPWSKSVLGWVDVLTLDPDTDHGTVVLPPVRETGTVLRYDVPGTERYYLVENRQPGGFDANLYAPGLLIWSVDDAVVRERWAANRVNAGGSGPGFGVSLIQADGAREMELYAANRGDAGDPFPGTSDQRDFHAGTVPGSLDRAGRAVAFTLTGTRQVGRDMVFELVTGRRTLSVTTTGQVGTGGLVRVNGELLPGGSGSASLAPFEGVVLEAEPGEVVEPGVRTPFAGWGDGVSGTRRELTMSRGDTAFVATYQGRELQVAMTLEGGRFGVAPGRIESEPASPGLWFGQGTAVTLSAVNRPGFRFTGWTGALAGAPNPAPLVVDAPLQAGAAFDYVFSVTTPAPVTVAAGDEVVVEIPVENGQAPLTWSLTAGVLPEGLQVGGSGLAGIPLETGSFDVSLLVRDAQGLEGTARVLLEVGVPDLALSVLARPFLSRSSGPTQGQATWLDRTGNGNGIFDLGDVRAYQRTRAGGAAGAPALVAPRAPGAPVTLPGLRLGPPGEGSTGAAPTAAASTPGGRP